MIKSKPWRGGPEEEYEAQHFGFGSQRMQIALRQMIECNIVSNVRDMEKYLISSLKLEGADKKCIKEACQKLMTVYCERADSSVQVIDDEISRILHVPDTVLLPEDEEQLMQISDEDYDALKNEVTCLKKRVERAALMEALLSAEEEELKKAEKTCDTAKKAMGAIDSWSTMLNETINQISAAQKETTELQLAAPFVKDKNYI